MPSRSNSAIGSSSRRSSTDSASTLGLRCSVAVNPAAQRQADVPGAKQVLHVPAQRPLQPLVAALDPDDDLGDRQHILKIDEHRRRPLALGGLEHPAQQGRLSVPPRPHEAERVTAVGERQQLVGLGIAIDHLLRRQWTGEAKRVDVPSGWHRRNGTACRPDVCGLAYFKSSGRHTERLHFKHGTTRTPSRWPLYVHSSDTATTGCTCAARIGRIAGPVLTPDRRSGKSPYHGPERRGARAPGPPPEASEGHANRLTCDP